MPYPLMAINLIAQAMRPQWNIDNAQRICEDYCHVDYEGGENLGDVVRRELLFGQVWDQKLPKQMVAQSITETQFNVYLYYETVTLNLLFSPITLLISPRPLPKQMVAA